MILPVSILQSLALVSDTERGVRLKFPEAPVNEAQAAMKDNNA